LFPKPRRRESHNTFGRDLGPKIHGNRITSGSVFEREQAKKKHKTKNEKPKAFFFTRGQKGKRLQKRLNRRGKSLGKRRIQKNASWGKVRGELGLKTPRKGTHSCTKRKIRIFSKNRASVGGHSPYPGDKGGTKGRGMARWAGSE